VLGDRVLPAGRLREPIAAAKCADALFVTERRRTPDATEPGGDRLTPDPTDEAALLARTLGVKAAFTIIRTLGDPAGISKDQRVFAIAGVARPERFFEDLRGAGWRVAGTLAFRDHHRFTPGDLDRIRRAANA